MAKSSNQKLKILYIAKILMESTDENHPITTPELIKKLDTLEIKAERKSIYNDIHSLCEFGMDIIKCTEKQGGYYLASREFEIAELKILVDSVAASRFITENKSKELVQKLERLASIEEAKMLHRQVVVTNRNKTENETIYYSVDQIHTAMNEDKTIKFKYFYWTAEKKKEFRKNGKFYEVSPWYLTWEDEKYYLVAFDHEAKKLKHYRVDKMLQLECTTKERQGKEQAEEFDITDCAKKTFGMFSGKEEMVVMLCNDKLTGVCMDQFGSDVFIRKEEDNRIRVRAAVEISQQFFGWVAGLGDQIKIASPEYVQKEFIKSLQSILSVYPNQD